MKFLSGIWGVQCIIFRDQGSIDFLGGGGGGGGSLLSRVDLNRLQRDCLAFFFFFFFFFSDCRYRGREFDPGPVPYFRGD